MPPYMPIKDPDSIVDYGIKWSLFLQAGETIVSSSWIIPSGLARGVDTITASGTAIWLGGGSAGKLYEVTNRITTNRNSGGSSVSVFTEDQTLIIEVKER